MFTVIFIGKEARSQNGSIISPENAEYLANSGPLHEGWVSGDRFDGSKIPEHTLVWKTAKEAQEFAETWKGHPWWVQPKSWRVVEVEPNMVQVRQGYRLAKGPRPMDRYSHLKAPSGEARLLLCGAYFQPGDSLVEHLDDVTCPRCIDRTLQGLGEDPQEECPGC